MPGKPIKIENKSQELSKLINRSFTAIAVVPVALDYPYF